MEYEADADGTVVSILIRKYINVVFVMEITNFATRKMMKFDNDMTLEQIRVLDVNRGQTTISHSALKRLCKVLVDRDDLTIFSDDTETSIIDDETGEIVLIIPSDEPPQSVWRTEGF